MNVPFVSVIILNYNGLRFLDTCLSAIQRITYPPDRFEVVLVDNASYDQSVVFVRERYSWVKIIVNPTNLGFAGGNNVGILATQSEYIALLNNDTAVEPGWLDSLVEIAESDPRIGACSSKLLLFHERLPLRITVAPPFEPRKHGFPLDGRTLGARLLEATLSAGTLEYIKGVYGPASNGQTCFRWLATEAWLGVPVVDPEHAVELRLRLAAPPLIDTKVRIAVWCNDRLLAEAEIGRKPVDLHIPLTSDLYAHATPVIQNAGSLVSLDGSGRDRGAVVEGPFHYYESDQGQYEQVEEVFAACGAACLYRRTMLEDVGLFDESFFMYYEDTDLSWRARLRGWKIVYVPHAVVRHVHCGSSGEWSPLFTFHVKKNRLAMVIKNGSWRQVILSWAGYLYALARSCGIWMRIFLTDRSAAWNAGHRLSMEFRAGIWTIVHWIELLKKRRRIQRTRLLPQQEIEKLFSPLVSVH